MSWVTSVAMFSFVGASTAAALVLVLLAPALEPAAPCMHRERANTVVVDRQPSQQIYALVRAHRQ